MSDPWIPDDLEAAADRVRGQFITDDGMFVNPIIDTAPDHACGRDDLCMPDSGWSHHRPEDYSPAELAHRGAPLAWLEGVQ